jgi:sigma-E factor negative regulatory protein RseB
LPQGFRLTQQVEQTLPGTDRPVSHLVFSDGLASVSVFIGAAVTLEAAQQQVGGTQQGAATTLVTVIDGKPAVVVGEVPLRTARMIASQLKAARSAVPAAPPAAAPVP